MRRFFRLPSLVVLLALGIRARPTADGGWTLIANSHFEIYSQGGAERGSAALLWFEQLRAFFEQQGMKTGDGMPVRVIGFRSVAEYNPYRLGMTADAYYIGSGSRNYIVMPALDANEFAIAAHEYAHLMVHRSGLKLPAWLNEGLAEYFSTVRIGPRGCELGGPVPRHLQTLKQQRWMNLGRLLTQEAEPAVKTDRDSAALFYAQSWALTEMLARSPEYESGFPELLAAVGQGKASVEALTDVYRRPLEAIAGDMHAWVEGAPARPVELPGMAVTGVATGESELSPFEARALMADLLAASGALDRAERQYRELARERPENAEIAAALGDISLRSGDKKGARQEFRRVIDAGIRDAGLCYRYALLADEAGLTQEEIRGALERALALKADFDDARYQLALTESNKGDYESAVAQFRAMKDVAAARAYGYWSALAYALGELGRRDEAKAAAEKAARSATSDAERADAAQLAYIAETDLTVQFTRDANGSLQLRTTRVAHGTSDWNPFIEPQDQMRQVEGELRKIECGGDNKVTGVDVETRAGTLQLEISDPLHVLMRNAPAEFTCGAQTPSRVLVEYAAAAQGARMDGVLRGMKFR